MVEDMWMQEIQTMPYHDHLTPITLSHIIIVIITDLFYHYIPSNSNHPIVQYILCYFSQQCTVCANSQYGIRYIHSYRTVLAENKIRSYRNDLYD